MIALIILGVGFCSLACLWFYLGLCAAASQADRKLEKERDEERRARMWAEAKMQEAKR